jgi:hypothetical protein
MGPLVAAIATALVLFLGATIVLISGLDSDRPGAASGGGDDAPPLDIATVADATAAHYLAAESEPATYRDVPCFCGCEEFLGHRHLYDCFVRADGRGWDAHAAGCGICIAESVTVQELRDAGHDVPSIRDVIIAQYGATTPTTARS